MLSSPFHFCNVLYPNWGFCIGPAFCLFFFLLVALPFSDFSNVSFSLSLSESSCQSSHSAPRFLPLCDCFRTFTLSLMWLLLIKPHFPPLNRSPKHKHGQMKDGRRVQTRENKWDEKSKEGRKLRGGWGLGKWQQSCFFGVSLCRVSVCVWKREKEVCERAGDISVRDAAKRLLE